MIPQSVLDAVQHDYSLSNEELNIDYSESIRDTVFRHFDESNSSFIIDDNLSANYLRYRLALDRPIDTLDYEPTVFRDHPGLINFVNSLILNEYNSTVFHVNFSPSLVVADNDSNTRYLYASRNYLCLDSSILVHNKSSLQKFLNTFKNFNLSDYLTSAQSKLTDKYDGAKVTTIAITVHITREPSLVYGYKPINISQQQQPQSQPQPQPQSQPQPQQQQQQQY